MNVDVLVIGSGAAGAAAALAAAQQGVKVAVVRRGYGATTMSSGAVRASLPQDLPDGARPLAAAAGVLTKLTPLLPLAERLECLNVLGRVVEADFLFPSMVRGALSLLKGKRVGIVGFKGLNECRPEPIVRAARQAGLNAEALHLSFPEAAHTRDLTTPELARLCDDLGPAEKLGKLLKKESEGFDVLALPPLAGLVAWHEVHRILDEALGEAWFELVAALPSVPGMRIQQALDQRLADEQISIVHGPLKAWAGGEGRIGAVRAGLAENEQEISLKEVVLATGGIIGRGLRVAGDGVEEVIFDLPLAQDEPSDDSDENRKAAFAVDASLRPGESSEKPAFENLRVAGELSGLAYGPAHGGLAVAAMTGWAAGELAGQAAQGNAQAEGRQGSWHEVDAEGDSAACVNCGLCLSRCPTVRALAREKQAYPGPRAMMANLVRYETELPEVADEMAMCTLCGACSIVCPACVPVPETITRARQVMSRVAPDAGPQAYQALRQAFDAPKKLFEAEPIEGPRLEQAENVLFIGCSLPYYEREHAEGTIKLLHALGVEFTLIDEVCCGGPLDVIGANTVEALAAHNVAEMRRVGAKRIITCCPRCAEVMSTAEEYRDFEVEHTTTLMARLLPGTEVAARLRDKVGGQQVTFHDPCERARLAGEVEHARAVLDAVGLEVNEMPRSGTFTECCGAGGGVRAAQTRTSLRMARLRVLDAVNTGAPTLLTECPSCLHNLYNGRKRKQKLEISNLSSFLGSQLD
jgi:Fe-S oxidoreductase/anaerobic glycerol-3-phosphate dehydrogenase